MHITEARECSLRRVPLSLAKEISFCMREMHANFVDREFAPFLRELSSLPYLLQLLLDLQRSEEQRAAHRVLHFAQIHKDVVLGEDFPAITGHRCTRCHAAIRNNRPEKWYRRKTSSHRPAAAPTDGCHAHHSPPAGQNLAARHTSTLLFPLCSRSRPRRCPHRPTAGDDSVPQTCMRHDLRQSVLVSFISFFPNFSFPFPPFPRRANDVLSYRSLDAYLTLSLSSHVLAVCESSLSLFLALSLYSLLFIASDSLDTHVNRESRRVNGRTRVDLSRAATIDSVESQGEGGKRQYAHRCPSAVRYKVPRHLRIVYDVPDWNCRANIRICREKNRVMWSLKADIAKYLRINVSLKSTSIFANIIRTREIPYESGKRKIFFWRQKSKSLNPWIEQIVLVRKANLSAMDKEK